MAIDFNSGSRSIQDRFDTQALSDRIDALLVSETISEHDRRFIEDRDMFFLATADAEGRPTCSYKGGEPGFVRVLDPYTVAFPNYDGNGMYLSTGNVLVNPAVGLLFIDFERGHRMRLDGTASIDFDDPLRDDYPEAQFVVRVRARAVYPNCPRYIHRYQLVRRSRFVPARRLPDAGPGVEALRLGGGRASPAGSCPRPRRPRGARPLTRHAAGVDTAGRMLPVLEGPLAHLLAHRFCLRAPGAGFSLVGPALVLDPRSSSGPYRPRGRKVPSGSHERKRT